MASDMAVAKCCVCASTKYSLPICAYIKLITSAFVSGLVTIWFFKFVTFAYRERIDIPFTVLATMLTLFSDAVFNVALIVGYHKRNVTLLRLCYRYGVFCIVGLTILLLAWIIVSSRSVLVPGSVIYVIIFTCLITGLIIIQTYLTFAARNEIFKLKAIERFRFVYPTSTSSS